MAVPPGSPGARGDRARTAARQATGLSTRRVGWGSIHDDVDSVWVLTPHELAIARELFGEVGRPEAAVAHWLGGDAEHMTALLRGRGWWHALEVSGRSAERKRAIELHCEQGVATLSDGWDEHISVFRGARDGMDEQRIEVSGELPLLAELRAFVGFLRGGPPPRSSAAEGAEAVSVIAELRELAARR